jgi:hypothetical protein
LPEPSATRAKGGAQSNFSLAPNHPRENQIRQIRASEQQNESCRRLKQKKKRKRKHVEFFTQLLGSLHSGSRKITSIFGLLRIAKP